MLGTTQRSRERRGASPGWAGGADRQTDRQVNRDRQEEADVSIQLEARNSRDGEEASPEAPETQDGMELGGCHGVRDSQEAEPH